MRLQLPYYFGTQMRAPLLFLVVVAVGPWLCPAVAQMNPVPRELGSFPLQHAAFVEVYADGPTVIGGDFQDILTLYSTTFDAGR